MNGYSAKQAAMHPLSHHQTHHNNLPMYQKIICQTHLVRRQLRCHRVSYQRNVKWDQEVLHCQDHHHLKYDEELQTTRLNKNQNHLIISEVTLW